MKIYRSFLQMLMLTSDHLLSRAKNQKICTNKIVLDQVIIAMCHNLWNNYISLPRLAKLISQLFNWICHSQFNIRKKWVQHPTKHTLEPRIWLLKFISISTYIKLLLISGSICCLMLKIVSEKILQRVNIYLREYGHWPNF